MTEILNGINAIWDIRLLAFGGGNSISVGQIILVLLLLVVGYLASRLTEYDPDRRFCRNR